MTEAQEQPGIGHNSDKPADVGGIAGARLKSFIDRIERLEEEKKALSDDLKDLYAEVKGTGYDAPTVRRIIRLRKMDLEKRREADALLETYMAALGMD